MVPATSATGGDTLARREKWLLLIGLSGANLIAAFAATAPIAAILPVLTVELRTDLAAVSWVLTIYQLASAGLVLTFGRLADVRGLRTIYAIGCVVFVVAQLLCGLAPDIVTLIGARVIAGIGSAAIFSTSPAILSRYCPPGERGKMLGWLLTIVTFGMALGPAVAGFVAELASWRWAFFGTIPLGLLVMALSLRVIPRDPPHRPARFDVAGAVTFLAGVSLSLLALNQGGAWGWTSPATVGAAAASVALLAAFVRIETGRPDPMLDLRLFRGRTFSAASTCAVLNYIATSGILVLVPLYLVQGRGVPPSQAGLYLITQPLARTIVGPVSGALSDRFGTWIPSAGGMALYAVGALMLARLGADSPLGELIVALVIAGIGAGAFLSPNTSAIMGAVPRAQQGTAGGVVSTVRTVGIAVGVVVAAAAVSAFTGGLVQPDTDRLFQGISFAFVVIAACAAVGALLSLLRDPATNASV